VGGQSVSLGPRSQGPRAASVLPLAYGTPRVAGLTVDRSSTATLPDCTSVDKFGRPLFGAGSVALVVNGVNFGNGSGLVVTVGGSPCELVASRTSQSRIVCVAPRLCRGAYSWTEGTHTH
jgi:hypothetical protein